MEGSQSRRQDREGNDLAEVLERLQQAPEGGWLRASRRPAWRIAGCAVLLKAEGVGESLCLADALECHPEPGRREVPRHASIPWPPPARMTQSSTLRSSAKIKKWRRLDPLLTALLRRLLLRRCLLTTFSHFAALLAMRSWRCRFSAHRESKRPAFRL